VTNDSTTTTHGWLNNEGVGDHGANKEADSDRAGAGNQEVGLGQQFLYWVLDLSHHE